ncbi:MAG: cysteine desulfurase [Anaerolineales bacterium]|nr:cysteine desulfurase [Anaerolineales bacterium]MCA9963068.1 cysteine desulfurase [Anaerolineales bacterium]
MLHLDNPIYLDNNATTRCDPAVVAAMLPYFSEWYGNAATGLHPLGRKAARAIEVAREQTAVLLNAHPTEIIFTSGATESNNLAILGLGRRAVGSQRKRIVTTSVEHKAVLEPCYALASLGYETIVLPVDSAGLVDISAAQDAINENTLFVTIQAANNEIGTLQPVSQLASLSHAVGALIHCDAAQAVGKIPVDVLAWNVDLLSLSAHKFYGPKGVGALYIRNGPRTIPLEPLTYGGGQEHAVRSGTSNVSGLVGLGVAAQLCMTLLPEESQRIRAMRDNLESQLLSNIPAVWVNGANAERLPNTLSLTIPNAEADALLLNLPGIMLGTGAACSTGTLEPSHVLQAIGLSRSDAGSTIRLSLGRFNSAEELALIVIKIAQAIDIYRTQNLHLLSST